MAAKTKYLLIDTNIYLQCSFLETVEGDDIDVLKLLHDLLDKGEVVLLLPEIIELELKRKFNNKAQELETKINALKKDVNTASLTERIRKEITDFVTELQVRREQNLEDVKKELESIFQHKNTISSELRLTPEVFMRAYKYMFHLEKPYKVYKDKPVDEEPKHFIQQDCLIIESIKEYLEEKKNYTLYIASLNKWDFADLDTLKGGSPKISKDIEGKFEKVVYGLNLSKILNKYFGTKIPAQSVEVFEKSIRQMEKDLQQVAVRLSGVLTPTLQQFEEVQRSLSPALAQFDSVSRSLQPVVQDIQKIIPLTQQAPFVPIAESSESVKKVRKSKSRPSKTKRAKK